MITSVMIDAVDRFTSNVAATSPDRDVDIVVPELFFERGSVVLSNGNCGLS